MVSTGIQEIIITQNTRSIFRSDILVTSNLLEKFIANGLMDEFKDFLKTSIDQQSASKDKILKKVVLFTPKFTSKIYSGNDINDVAIPGAIKSQLSSANEPIVEFGKNDGEVFWPVKTSSLCITCHEDQKMGELGGVLFIRFSLAKLREENFINTILGICTILVVFVLLSLVIFLVLNIYVKRPVAENYRNPFRNGRGKPQDAQQILEQG